MIRKLVLKRKIKKICNYLGTFDELTQRECVGIIKKVLRKCPSDRKRSEYISEVYKEFVCRGWV